MNKPFDADNHYYETEDCFTRFMPSNQMDLAVQWKEVNGERKLYVGEKPFTVLKSPAFKTVSAPGTLSAALKEGVHQAEADGSTTIETPKEFKTDRDARVELMKSQGLGGALMLPSLGVLVEHFMTDNPVQTFANLRSFNLWLNEQWGFDYKDRIYGVPLLSLIDIDMAVEELERVLKLGAKAIHLRPGPQAGKSLADPTYDPFWERLNEAKIPLALHISESGYNELFSTKWGEEANPSSHEQSAFQWVSYFGDRPMMDTISSMIFYNLFQRFPNINVLSIENGSLWVSYIIAAMDKMKGMARKGPWPGGYVKGRPSEIFKRHIFVSPYYEEDVVTLSNLIGHTQVLFGSDFPHMEGLASPVEFQESIATLPGNQQDDIMSNNIRKLLGIAA